MRNGIFIALLAAALNAPAAVTLDDLIAALSDMPGYAANVRYAITLPQAEDDVVYTVDLAQPTAGSYLIDWSVNSPSGLVEGWTAWFDGHFYDFRNNRLREVHAGWDSTLRPPQETAQFASLLPQRLASQLAELRDSATYTYNIIDRGDEIRIEADRHSRGDVDAELAWTFDAESLTPTAFYADYNPGAMASQQVDAKYTSQPSALTSPLSEPVLQERYPLAFEKFRESQFAIESLRGEPLPAFALPSSRGERMTRSRGEAFPRPTLVALLDPESALAPRLVAELREAVDRMPADTDVIYALTSKDPDSPAELLGELRPGETALTGAAGFIRECGAATLPVILVCNPAGRVADLRIGLNNQLAADVMCMLSTMK